MIIYTTKIIFLKCPISAFFLFWNWIVSNNYGRHDLLSFLSSLPISVLRNLELEANTLYDSANKLYKAALLTRCYV